MIARRTLEFSEARAQGMSKLLAIVGATVGGGLGWWLGALVGVATAFFLSVLGTAGGVYLGRRVSRQYLE